MARARLLTFAFNSTAIAQDAEQEQPTDHSREETYQLTTDADTCSIYFASVKQMIVATKQILQGFKNTQWEAADSDEINELEVRLSSLNDDMKISISTSGIDTLAQDSVARSVQDNLPEQPRHQNPACTLQQSRIIHLKFTPTANPSYSLSLGSIQLS